MNMPPDRLIEIPGCYNLRDVGGYPTGNGQTTRWRALLRSASPHHMPLESWDALGELGVRTLIDLRRPSEADEESYRHAVREHMRYRPLPLFDDEGYQVVDVPANNLGELYVRMLDYCGAQFATVLREIAHDEAPTLVHCAVGKDRTGMVIALALAAVGVEAETIATDYAQSSALLAPLKEAALASEQARGGNVARLTRMFESRHEVMLETLAYLDQRYGGIGGYLEANALEAATVVALRRKLVS